MSGAHSAYRTPNRLLFDDKGGLVRHVLDYRPPLVRASKHWAGRTKSMTAEERRVRDRFNRRRTQVSKTQWVDLAKILAAANA